MIRAVAIFLTSGALLVTPFDTQVPANTVNVRVQEGYPIDVINRLQARTDKLRRNMQNFNSQHVQSVITTSKLWVLKDNPLTVAFLGGSPQLRSKIMQALQPWEAASAIRFDFGPNVSQGIFREWTRADTSYKADIRIAFDEVGYWSFVGTDSIDPTVTEPNQSSMNFQGFTNSFPPDWTGTVLHEFGHALGLQHEHQSPNADCTNEFRWANDLGYIPTQDQYGSFVPDAQGRRPGIYTVLGGPPNSWKPAQIDFNLKQLPNDAIYNASAFDPKSIMMYSFPDWMFRQGGTSPCFVTENVALSSQDAAAALKIFPKDPAEAQQALLNVRQSLQSLQSLSSKRIPGSMKTQYQNRLSDINR